MSNEKRMKGLTEEGCEGKEVVVVRSGEGGDEEERKKRRTIGMK